MPKKTKTLLITGASSGIGRDCALYFDKMGYQVFAGVRNTKDAKALEKQSQYQLKTVLLDITKPDDIQNAVAFIKKEVGPEGLDGLINNAGVAFNGPVEFLKIQDLQDQFNINVIGTVALTQACMPLLRTAKGRIINLSSVSGRFAAPFLAPYAASKYALEAISDSLRVELLPSGIKVILIEPGSIKTPIWQKAQETSKKTINRIPAHGKKIYAKEIDFIMKSPDIAMKLALPVEKVTKTIEKALTVKRPKIRYKIGLDTFFLTSVLNLVPRAIVDKMISLTLRGF